MSRVFTNNTTLQVADEQTLGVLPGSPTWTTIEENSIGKYGPEIKTVARTPISKNRQRRKGKTVDLDSGAEFETDTTMGHLKRFLGPATFSKPNGPTVGLADGAPFRPTGVTATGYTVASGGAVPQNYLILARGFSNAANNGLKVVSAGSVGTEIKTSGLVVEAGIPDANNATVEICGFQGTAGDIQINGSGNILTTALDCTTLGLTDGQFLWVGGAIGGALVFANTAYRGLARVRGTITATVIPLDKRDWTVGAADNGAGKTIQLFFGNFFRNVAVDDTDFVQTSIQMELALPDLGGVGTPQYRYSKGLYINEFTWSLPLTDKSTLGIAAIGTDTSDPSGTRATNASAGRRQVEVDSFSTANEIIRCRVTQTNETTICNGDFKSATLTLKNNVSPEKALATLGARYIDYGFMEVDVDTQVILTDGQLAAAARANTTITMEMAVRNTDGGFCVDLPSVTASGDKLDFPQNESVLESVQFGAFQDATLGYTLSFSIFPYLPNP